MIIATEYINTSEATYGRAAMNGSSATYLEAESHLHSTVKLHWRAMPNYNLRMLIADQQRLLSKIPGTGDGDIVVKLGFDKAEPESYLLDKPISLAEIHEYCESRLAVSVGFCCLGSVDPTWQGYQPKTNSVEMRAAWIDRPGRATEVAGVVANSRRQTLPAAVTQLVIARADEVLALGIAHDLTGGSPHRQT